MAKKKTTRQFIVENATIPKYAFGNRSNKDFWRGYKSGWSDCIWNLLSELKSEKEEKSKNG